MGYLFQRHVHGTRKWLQTRDRWDDLPVEQIAASTFAKFLRHIPEDDTCWIMMSNKEWCIRGRWVKKGGYQLRKAQKAPAYLTSTTSWTMFSPEQMQMMGQQLSQQYIAHRQQQEMMNQPGSYQQQVLQQQQQGSLLKGIFGWSSPWWLP